jgi:hypothetical protein
MITRCLWRSDFKPLSWFEGPGIAQDLAVLVWNKFFICKAPQVVCPSAALSPKRFTLLDGECFYLPKLDPSTIEAEKRPFWMAYPLDNGGFPLWFHV